MRFLGERFKARLATTPEDVLACKRLRYLAFIDARGLHDDSRSEQLDHDEFDQHCSHMMVEETRTGQLVCCFRMMALNDGSELPKTYSAKYYDLERLTRYPGRMVEMGRFCMHPAWKHPAILRVAWTAMTQFVDDEKVDLLFGCSSFYGVNSDTYHDAFALLKEKHLAPKRWLPLMKAQKVFEFARTLRFRRPDMKQALRHMPPLLRTYLVMGGWVSDHAVIDEELNTLHVFTGIEISQVPDKRARLLRGH